MRRNILRQMNILRKKIFELSDRLGKGQTTQIRKANNLVDLLRSNKGNVKKKFETQIRNIKERINKPSTVVKESAFKSRVKDIVLTFRSKAEVLKPLKSIYKYIGEISNQMKIQTPLLFQINVTYLLRYTLDGSIGIFNKYSDKTVIYNNNRREIYNAMAAAINDVYGKMIDQEDDGASGAKIDRVMRIVLMLSHYNPMKGSSYFELPHKIKNTKACINIKNEDDECFKYSIQCGFYEVYKNEHPEKIYHYKKIEDKLDWSMLSFPFKLNDIDKFEKKNNISITVTGLNKKIILFLYIKQN